MNILYLETLHLRHIIYLGITACINRLYTDSIAFDLKLYLLGSNQLAGAIIFYLSESLQLNLFYFYSLIFGHKTSLLICLKSLYYLLIEYHSVLVTSPSLINIRSPKDIGTSMSPIYGSLPSNGRKDDVDIINN